VLLLGGLLVNTWSSHHEPTALANAAIRSNDHSMITTRAGAADVLAIIDDRAETLLIYEVVNQNEVRLSARQHLPRLFENARGGRRGGAGAAGGAAGAGAGGG
jgi:hypothetical protein